MVMLIDDRIASPRFGECAYIVPARSCRVCNLQHDFPRASKVAGVDFGNIHKSPRFLLFK